MKVFFGGLILTFLMMFNLGATADPAKKPEICSYCSPTCVCGAPPMTKCIYDCPKDTNQVFALCEKKCHKTCEVCRNSQESCPPECTMICEKSPWSLSEQSWNLDNWNKEWKTADCQSPLPSENPADPTYKKLPNMNKPGYE